MTAIAVIAYCIWKKKQTNTTNDKYTTAMTEISNQNNINVEYINAITDISNV